MVECSFNISLSPLLTLCVFSPQVCQKAAAPGENTCEYSQRQRSDSAWMFSHSCVFLSSAAETQVVVVEVQSEKEENTDNQPFPPRSVRCSKMQILEALKHRLKLIFNMFEFHVVNHKK